MNGMPVMMMHSDAEILCTEKKKLHAVSGSGSGGRVNRAFMEIIIKFGRANGKSGSSNFYFSPGASPSPSPRTYTYIRPGLSIQNHGRHDTTKVKRNPSNGIASACLLPNLSCILSPVSSQYSNHHEREPKRPTPVSTKRIRIYDALMIP